jgi:DNA-binding transcriptional MerR regulator/effector-binding domain-containing protein
VTGLLLPIGEFSRRSRLPVSTLRYYHHRGLLEPAQVDPATGYRYYRAEQLALAEVVGELRRAGVAPAVIGEITSGRVALAAALDAERRRIEGEIQQQRGALAALDRLLDRPPAAGGSASGRLGGSFSGRLGGSVSGRLGGAGVRREEELGREVPAVQGVVRGASAVAGVLRLIARLRRQLRSLGMPADGAYGAIFPLDLTEDPIPTTVFADFGPGCPPSIGTVVLPARPAVVTDHVGDHHLAPAYDVLLRWFDENELEPVAPVIEEYGGGAHRPRTRLSIGVRT